MAPSASHIAWSLLSAASLTLAYPQQTTSPISTANGVTSSPSSYATSSTGSAATAEFTVPASADVGKTLLPNIYDPEAKDAQEVCPGYTLSNVTRTTFGLNGTLSLAGDACNVYGTDIEELVLTVQYQSGDRLSINITPKNIDSSNASWYILDEDLVAAPKVDADAESTLGENDLQFVYSNDPTFSFSVVRRSTGDILYTTMGSKLVYENQFIELVTTLPENYNVYGLGEQMHAFRLGNNYTATIYAADAGDPLDRNIYGSHPYYLETRYFEKDPDTGNLTLVTSNTTDTDAEYVSYSHGVYLRNAHGQEVLLRPEGITWRALGGSIDLYFFDGPSAEDVTKQYQVGAIGLPAMQQYFAFGYHQCRWGYHNWTELDEVVENFKKFGIPLETIWTDIDYMRQYRDFTVDPNAFPLAEAKEFLSKIHSQGQHYVPIVDSAIYIPNPENESDAYAVYERGHEADVFLKNPDGSEYIGAVWPGYTVFPDWTAENATSWWVDEFVRWHKDVEFDGIWIDMSEVSSFCVGSCGTGNLTLNPVHPSFLLPGEPGDVPYDYPEYFEVTNSTEAASASLASSQQAAAVAATAASTSSTPYYRSTPTPGVRDVNYPPYVINHVQTGADLAVHAVSPNATHVGGLQEYDVHNLFGHHILRATYDALLSVFPGIRPFIIGRSTFAGSGKWAGHWGGDNTSKWYYMYFSIPQALHFSLFGIPMFGVDTCGFSGNTDEELCNRWMQLSAFFPFYRNHNTLATISQEPYIWASVTEAAKKAMNIRYSLLPYMYTLFHSSHTTGSTVMRALSWEFPNDPSLAAADRQFLLGPSILVTPVLTPGATSVDGVFPGVAKGEVWYDWYNQSAVAAKAGVNTTIEAPLGHIPVYIRGNSILPIQEPGYTTTESRKNPWGLIVALSQQGTAAGGIYLDDGKSVTPNATLRVSLEATKGTLYASAFGTWKEKPALANVTILGVSSFGGNVTFNGEMLSAGVSFNETSKVLSVTGLESKTNVTGAWGRDWELSWA